MRTRRKRGEVAPETVDVQSDSDERMPRRITRLRFISIDALRPGSFNGRGDLSVQDRSIAELADSIAASGIIEPLVVRGADAGVFEVIAGERRLAAAQLLNLSRVPCVVKDCTERDALMISLTENLQRKDLSPMEKAHGLSRLLDDFELTQEQIGKQVGMSQSAIAHYLRLLDLPAEVQSLIHEGELSMGHGKVLAGVGDKNRVVELALDCVSNGRSVRDLETSLKNDSTAEKGRRHRDSSRRSREEVELPNGVFIVIKGSLTQQNCGMIEIPYWSQQEKEWAIAALAGGGSTAGKPASDGRGVSIGPHGKSRSADLSRFGVRASSLSCVGAAAASPGSAGIVQRRNIEAMP